MIWEAEDLTNPEGGGIPAPRQRDLQVHITKSEDQRKTPETYKDKSANKRSTISDMDLDKCNGLPGSQQGPQQWNTVKIVNNECLYNKILSITNKFLSPGRS